MLDTLKNIFFPEKRVKLLRAINKAIDERDSIQKSIDAKEQSFALIIETIDDAEILKGYENTYYNELAELNSSKLKANKKISDLHLLFSDEIFKSEDGEKTGKLRYQDKMESSLNYKREDMPQIDSDSIGDFIIHFGEKAGIKKVKKTISKLKPSQGEINDDKVHDVIGEQFSEGYDGSKVRYIISSDDYILDGHHRWAGDLELDPNKKVECYQVNLPIKILIQRAKKLKISNKRDIQDNAIEKSELLINYETLEDLPISNFYKSLIVEENRPVGIPNDEFIKTIEIVKSLEGQEIFEKAKASIAGKRPVRRIVRRKDGTVFSQVFWESIEETENVPKTERPVKEKMDASVKKLYDEQLFADRLVKKGDIVNVRFVGSIYAGKYNFKGWKVLSVKADRIIVECPENIHTRQPAENPVSFRKGARIEIPKGNNPLWSEFQGFELDLSEEELVARKKWLGSVVNLDYIKQANKEGYRIMPNLVNKTEQQVAENLEKFNEQWNGFDPLHMFRKMDNNIKSHFGEGAQKDFSFSNTSRGGFDFSISINKPDEGRVMYMNRTSDDGRHNPDGIYNGKKGVYHNYFKISPKYQGGGFAKKMFKELYDQYKASGVDYLAVHANINVGGYTWGSMGFQTNNLSEARSLLGCFERQKGKLRQIRNAFVVKGKDGVEDIKIEKGKIFIKKEGDKDFKDVTNEKTIKPEFVEKYQKLQEEFEHLTIEAMGASGIFENEDGEYTEVEVKDAQESLEKYRNRINEIENEIDSIPTRKRYELDSNDSLVDIKNCGFYKITQQDCDEALEVFQNWVRKNPNKQRFPVKLFCAIGNKKAGQAALLNTSWHGTINLNDPEERNHFERYLGYESNEIKPQTKNK